VLTTTSYNLNLFEPRSPDSFVLTFKDTTQENWQKVHQVYNKVGLTEKILSIQQPSGSAEINSQNFKIILESGNFLLLRRCKRLKGKENYENLYSLFNKLRENGVRVPEFCSLSSQKEVPYFEFDDVDGKVCWVFFKYIEVEKYFSGYSHELMEAAEQIGKMHSCLKQNYGNKAAIALNLGDVDNKPGPFLKNSEWNKYLKYIEDKIKVQADEYDQMFMENKGLIERMIKFVEDNYSTLLCIDDIQNIHFDLNSSNFIVDKQKRITIMDFDEVRVGNIYTDISFAFHRLITTCLEQNEKEVSDTIQTFIESYKKGNPSLKFDPHKLFIAAYDRALRNIRSNLILKYEQKSKDWLSSIPLNIKRLKQVEFLTEKVKPFTSCNL
jgi:hypothetical protein